MHFDMRVGLAEAGQQLGQQAQGRGRAKGGNAQASACDAALCLCFLLQCFLLLKNVLGAHQQAAAHLGEGDRRPLAVEQAQAQCGFELLDGVADAALRDAEHRRCTREATCLGKRCEDLELAKGHGSVRPEGYEYLLIRPFIWISR